MNGMRLANNPFAVMKESVSTRKFHDCSDDAAKGIVKYILPQDVLCELVNNRNFGVKG